MVKFFNNIRRKRLDLNIESVLFIFYKNDYDTNFRHIVVNNCLMTK